ncbi:hypothetical protein GCM10011391_08580 [Pullulanibacillus camelliae]|uniref:LysM domain-containing protein n=1 Tax=Pullulanibacillus camelliae TaxID=1707096 RepID=A0A8J2VM94_9BACL|nr:cell wall hydrolase [Pullulanibacillus camelliae]GGE32202.1 hypothetical protein GCM10011391_08580 [Pullulanibacillus camelliae]
MKKWLMMIALSTSVIGPGAKSFAYTAHSGDTLSTIAQAHHMTVHQVLAMNPQITDPNAISIGQAIHLEKMTVSAEDRKLLAQLIHAEAGGEPFRGKVKVAQVVLNRVKSPQFPNSIRNVIMQKGQFSPVANGSIQNTPSASDYMAADTALNEENNGDGSLYFFNPEIAADSQWFSSLETTTVIGHHVFKK